MNNTLQLPPILDFNETSNKGTLFDTRDGQSYKVVKIGKQIWTAENFRYLPPNEEEPPLYNYGKFENDQQLLFGRYYNYKTATKIAPEGWHLPTKEDFIELFKFILNDNNFILDPPQTQLTLTNKKFIIDTFNPEQYPYLSIYLRHKPNTPKPSPYDGYDKYGFNLLCSPYFYNPEHLQGLFYFSNSSFLWFQQNTNKTNEYKKSIKINLDKVSFATSNPASDYFNVRLIKD